MKSNSSHQTPPAQAANSAAPASTPDPSAELTATLAERTADLQRTRADFENFRKQTELQKQQAITVARYATVEKFLPLIDDLDRALSAYPDQLSPLKKSITKTIHSLGLELHGCFRQTLGLRRHFYDARRHGAADKSPVHSAFHRQCLAEYAVRRSLGYTASPLPFSGKSEVYSPVVQRAALSVFVHHFELDHGQIGPVGLEAFRILEGRDFQCGRLSCCPDGIAAPLVAVGIISYSLYHPGLECDI